MNTTIEDNLPKYETFSRFLLEQVQTGVYKPGDKLPSEREMAKKYNIAHMTINKALNGLVSAGYLERIPPKGTYVRKQRRLKSATVVMDYRATHAIFPQSLQHAMADAGYVLSVFDIYNVANRPDFFIEFCRQQHQDLLLVEGYSVFPFTKLKEILPESPLIVFGRYEHDLELPGASFVLSDTEQTGTLAMQMLVNQGCRRIGILIGDPDIPTHVDLQIVSSAKKFLKEAGLPEPTVLTLSEQTPEKIVELLSNHTCDGYFGLIDSYLIPLVKIARKLHIAIPDKIVLVGRNNTPWADSFDLTSLDLQPGELTNVIRDLLESPHEKNNIKIPVKPVYRHSCPKDEI